MNLQFKDEKRAYPRVCCELVGHQEQGEQKVLNLSRGGLYLETAQQYSEESPVTVFLKHPDDGSLVSLPGRVVRKQVLATQQYGYGIQFEPLEDKDAKTVEMLLATEPVYAKVKDVFKELLSNESYQNFRRDASVVNDLQVDSLKVAELSILLEQSLRRSIFLPDWLTSKESPEELTVSSLVHFLADGS